jgi:hypothetical protein
MRVVRVRYGMARRAIDLGDSRGARVIGVCKRSVYGIEIGELAAGEVRHSTGIGSEYVARDAILQGIDCMTIAAWIAGRRPLRGRLGTEVRDIGDVVLAALVLRDDPGKAVARGQARHGDNRGYRRGTVSYPGIPRYVRASETRGSSRSRRTLRSWRSCVSLRARRADRPRAPHKRETNSREASC